LGALKVQSIGYNELKVFPATSGIIKNGIGRRDEYMAAWWQKTGLVKDYITGFNAPNLRFFISPHSVVSTD